MSTILFTLTELERQDYVVSKLARSGYYTSIDGPAIQVMINTIFVFDSDGGNIQSQVIKVKQEIKNLNSLTKSKWFLASSHPKFIEKF